MLCYQSSRNIPQVISDSIQWLLQNRRLVSVLAIPIALVCIVSAFIVTNFNVDIPLDGKNPLFNNIWPVQSKFANSTLAICLIGLTIALLLTPALSHYFVDRRSLHDLTLSKLAKLMYDNILTTISVSAITVVVIVIFANSNIMISIAALLLYFLIVPFVIMRTPPILPTLSGLFNSLLALSMVLFVLYVCKTLPNLLTTILTDLVFPMIYDTGNYFRSEDIPGIGIFLVLVTSITLSLGITVMLIASILFHGTIFTNNDEN